MAQGLLGNEVPRVYTPPLRELTPETSLGFSLIAFADMLGIPLLPWQRWLAIHMLELLPNGKFRFRTVILLVARQNGKSTFSQILALFFMYVVEVPMVLSTAQNLDIAEEVFAGGVEIAQNDPELAPLIVREVRVNGKRALELDNGARWKVQAATRRGGRGLSGDLVFLDELREHQNWNAWSAISKTTMARDNSIVFVLSNAGDISSVVLRHLRMQAHKALGDPDGLWIDPATGQPIEEEVIDLDDEELPTDETLGIFEWSAKPGRSTRDRKGWQEANPSLGHTITEKAIMAALISDPEWTFRTEVLCQWFDGATEGPFPSGTWAGSTDPESRLDPTSRVVYGVDTSWDRTMTRIAIAGYRPDGLPHFEVVASRAGTDWVIPWLEDPARAFKPAGVVWQVNGAPVSSITDGLRKSKLPLIEWAGSDLSRATGQFYDAIAHLDDDEQHDPLIFHRPQPALDVAANTALPKAAGDGWLWDRSKSPADISPLVAATGAVWGLLNKEVVNRRSAYEAEDAELMML
ncbi:terminase [Microbacterium phage Coltrane]|uniref:Terminase n=6 Tax=Armstrongvirus armstrong TaxID=2734217 RepID=A0A3G2KD99_9CAUD|nr:terminase large subunit [Microbacterium phage Armstrong]AYN55875.1 terminase [Microbacterium phage Brahms]AYN56981.1 terminase [Microbacterium phage Bernstein]AYN57340.1 terminase [Microbacterium phage Coltrane]AYN58928.1 terminase [Microbacterium phage Rollins]QED11425.1 terminase [Microbacterium phage Vitas]UGL61969.1 terminase large subunit [Microbacterium phage Skylord]UOK18155.1 terminase large subunit [Microbacterium phage Clayda5]